MKKRIILITLIIAVSSMCGYSQILSNTTWMVYDNSGTLQGYISFNTDTVASSWDNISYDNFSIYQENGNNISFIDLPDGLCTISDTGRYTFLVQNDTLKYSLVNDLCSDRTLSLCSFHWIRLNTGINNENLLPALKIFPNPASDFIVIETPHSLEIDILNIRGQLIKTIYTAEKLTSIDVADLSSGIYIIKAKSDRGIAVKKFFKE
jgi:hypothetical protein